MSAACGGSSDDDVTGRPFQLGGVGEPVSSLSFELL